MVESLRPYLSVGHAEYLSDLLEGKDVPGKIEFKGLIKQLGEFFKRMLYNQKLLNTVKDDVENWVCRNSLNRNSNTGTFQELKKNSVHYAMSKDSAKLSAEKGIPPSWMEYKAPSQLKNLK